MGHYEFYMRCQSPWSAPTTAPLPHLPPPPGPICQLLIFLYGLWLSAFHAVYSVSLSAWPQSRSENCSTARTAWFMLDQCKICPQGQLLRGYLGVFLPLLVRGENETGGVTSMIGSAPCVHSSQVQFDPIGCCLSYCSTLFQVFDISATVVNLQTLKGQFTPKKHVAFKTHRTILYTKCNTTICIVFCI